MNELMAHLSKFFNVMVQKGGGHSHYGITYQNKNLKL